ncbi:MAG: PH domain-containing protein [Alphaproteobacteria bacterium]|nr:PH domain-containing protein [Alphaproteobacteria bacterium]
MDKKDVSFHEPVRGYRPSRLTYIGRMLLPDEYVLYMAGLHWIIYDFGVATTLFGILLWNYNGLLANMLLSGRAAGYVVLPMQFIAVASIVIGVLNLLFVFIRHISTRLVVTNERVIFKHGLIAVEVRENTLPKVASVDIQQSFLGAFLGYGMVEVKGSGADLPPVDHVDDPYTFYYNVMHAQRSIEHPEIARTGPTIEHVPQKLGAPSPAKIGRSPSVHNDEEHEHAEQAEHDNDDHNDNDDEDDD